MAIADFEIDVWVEGVLTTGYARYDHKLAERDENGTFRGYTYYCYIYDSAARTNRLLRDPYTLPFIDRPVVATQTIDLGNGQEATESYIAMGTDYTDNFTSGVPDDDFPAAATLLYGARFA